MRRLPLAFVSVLALAGVVSLTDCVGSLGSSNDPPPPAPFVPDTPATYVAKVKNILVGLPPTDAEVQAVVANPNALPGLIDQWMAMPEYSQKMMIFFELAFQQTQLQNADFQDMVQRNGIGAGSGIPSLIQNIQESFARTVLALLESGQPLNVAMTTNQYMMTPALMEFYSFLDTNNVNDAGTVADNFFKANPNLTIVLDGVNQIPVSESVDPTSPNFMHWYNPDVATLTYVPPVSAACNKMQSFTYPPSNTTGYDLHFILFGGMPDHKAADGTRCPVRAGKNGNQFTDPTDFSDWRMVTVRPPNGAEATTKFYDIPSLRTATELVLKTPRIGFFSTPAFFANWSTNASNQMRVTLNQSLIVATGMDVDGNDTTIPPQTPGLDEAHSAPGSPCYSCHQTLDPMRSIMSSTYSWFYSPQADQTLMAQPGLFAFRGVVKPMSTINDFANNLATHPAFGQAWAQKLCYYVNSQPCLAGDLEFQRVVKDFQNSNYNWNSLVRELMASPLTTNASATTTTTNSEVVAVVRRDHLCAQLNNRLGLVDVCKLDQQSTTKPSVISEIVSGLPSDGYGRGSTIPVLPNQPTLFYRSGLENMCEAVALKVIDTAPDPLQPSMKHWVSTSPDAAIADFVAIVMALVPSDPRSAQATTILTNHYQSALQMKASASDALRSTFTAACLAPSAVGLGL